MKFVEMTGAMMAEIIDDNEIHAEDLITAGVTTTTIVRINEQGDIEVRRPTKWDVIGGLLGEFEARVHKSTGFDWV